METWVRERVLQRYVREKCTQFTDPLSILKMRISYLKLRIYKIKYQIKLFD